MKTYEGKKKHNHRIDWDLNKCLLAHQEKKRKKEINKNSGIIANDEVQCCTC